MLKIENTEVVGWEAAIRGMRNPMNSWEKSDSSSGVATKDTNIQVIEPIDGITHGYFLGTNDAELMTRLRNAGTDHRKFMRMITVYLDITAPLYWWKEFDTYKVGTVANSCSTMHKIADKKFTLEDFSYEHLIQTEVGIQNNLYIDCSGVHDESSIYTPFGVLCSTIEMLNVCRERYLAACKTEAETGFSAKDIWWQMIQLLPTSYNQRRTVMLNYEVLANIYKSRRNHKLDEWHTFCEWITGLPYSELITGTKCVNEKCSSDNQADDTEVDRWAKREIELACAQERAGCENEHDASYGIGCYESALKAYHCLAQDGHSGFSIQLTKGILNRLIDGKCLTPIEDTPDIWTEVSFGDDDDTTVIYQCKRMSSLFKHVRTNGEVTYRDVQRVQVIYAANPDVAWSNGLATNLIDKLFPITMPYLPKSKKFVIMAEDCLVDEKNDDYDTVGYLDVITPEGEKIELNAFFKETKDGMLPIEKEEYEERKAAAKARLEKNKSDKE